MQEKEYYKPGPNKGQIRRITLAVWQSRLEMAGTMARFVEIWAPKIVLTDKEIPRPQIQRQRVEIGTLVGEIKLP